MSFSFWKPTPYDHRQRENNWLNGIVHLHDNFCGCDQPFHHLVWKLAENNSTTTLSKHHFDLLQKCLPSTTTDGTTGEGPSTADDAGEEEPLDDGDLERLFDEDFGEEPR